MAMNSTTTASSFRPRVLTGDTPTGRLHLVAPARDEAIVIERVLPPEPPAASVVARR